MEFEWDERKRLTNVKKHGVDFRDVPSAWRGIIVDPFAENWDRGEHRRIAVGAITTSEGEKFVAIVYTPREGRHRIITARPARRHEREAYDMALGRSGR